MISQPHLFQEIILTQTLAPAATEATRATRFIHVMPLAFITYGLAYLDRVNYASAAKDMGVSLHLSANMAPLLSSIFFLGYCVFQIPGAMYASKRNVKWLIFWALFFWGGLSALTGVIRNVPLLMVDRILLGAVEGVVLPAMLIYLTRWFTKRERSRSNMILMLTNPVTMFFTSILCGSIIAYFNIHRVGRFGGWQMMFIIEGLPSIIWAFLWLRIADERPAEADWLSPVQTASLLETLDEEQQHIASVSGYRAAFFDFRVLRLAAIFLCFCSASYGLMMWLPGIVEDGVGKRPFLVGVLTCMPYGVAIVAMIVTAWISDRTLRRKTFVVGSLVIAAIAYGLISLAQPGQFLFMFVGFLVAGACIYTPTSPLWAWMAEMLPRNVAGESMALVNSAGALGGLIGTYMVGFLLIHFHTNKAAFIFQASCFAVAAILAASVRSTVKKAKRLEAVQDASPALQATAQ